MQDKRDYQGAKLRHVVQSVIDQEVDEKLRGKEVIIRNRGASAGVPPPAPPGNY